jgi:hypothetical protein
MFRAPLVLLVLCSASLAQTSSDGSFSVRHLKKEHFALDPAQMREAESIYHNACVIVQRDFRNSAVELHPHFAVILGADRDEVHARREQPDQILMKRWDPVIFAQGVVLLAFDEVLTPDLIRQMRDRALRITNSSVDVTALK